jgi:hypothetical protein
MRQFDVFLDNLVFAWVALRMHFFYDLIVREIVDIHKAMLLMRANARKQLRKNIRVISNNDF